MQETRAAVKKNNKKTSLCSPTVKCNSSLTNANFSSTYTRIEQKAPSLVGSFVSFQSFFYVFMSIEAVRLLFCALC